MINKIDNSFRIMHLIFCVIFCISFAPFPTACAQTEYFLNETFDNTNALDTFTKNLPSPMAAVITNNQLDLHTTASASSGAVGSITKMLSKPLTFQAGKKYVFAFDYTTDRAGEMRNVFTVNGGDFNSNLYLARLNAIGGSLAVLYPGGNAAINSDTASGAFLKINTLYHFMYIVDGTTRRVERVYINEEEIPVDDITKFPVLPSTITSVSIFQKNWNRTSTKYDNLKIYQADTLHIVGTTLNNNFSPFQDSVEITFNNILAESDGNAVSLSTEAGQLLPAPTCSIIGNVMRVKLSCALEADAKYILRIGNVIDIFGGSVSGDEFSFNTAAVEAYYANDDFDTEEGITKYSAAEDVSVLSNPESMLSFFIPENEEYVTITPEFSFVRTLDSALSLEDDTAYVFELDFRTDFGGHMRKFFSYGSGTDDFLFAVRPVSGRDGLLLTVTDDEATVLSDSAVILPDEWVKLMVVVQGSTKQYDIYMNNMKLNSVPISKAAMPDMIPSIAFRHTTQGTAVTDDYDNISIYKLAQFEKLTLTDCSVDAMANTYTEQIFLTFNQMIDAETVDEVTLKSAEGMSIGITTSVNNDNSNVLDIYLSGNLRSNTDYTIQFEKVRSQHAFGGVDEAVQFRTDDALNITRPIIEYGNDNISDGELSAGEITAYTYVDNAGYEGVENQVALMLLYYNGTKLIGVVAEEVQGLTDAAQRISVSLPVRDIGIGCYVKAYVVNNLSEMKPVRKSVRTDIIN